MPLHRDDIRAIPESELRERARTQLKERSERKPDTWLSPHYNDGGWHATPGVPTFDPHSIEPLGDHILLELDSEPEAQGVIIKPQTALNQERNCRIGTVLKVGPGKWKESVTHKKTDLGVRLPMTLKVGDRVMIGPWSDWESWDADHEANGPNVVLCQEADVRFVISEDAAV